MKRCSTSHVLGKLNHSGATSHVLEYLNLKRVRPNVKRGCEATETSSVGQLLGRPVGRFL